MDSSIVPPPPLSVLLSLCLSVPPFISPFLARSLAPSLPPSLPLFQTRAYTCTHTHARTHARTLSHARARARANTHTHTHTHKHQFAESLREKPYIQKRPAWVRELDRLLSSGEKAEIQARRDETRYDGPWRLRHYIPISSCAKIYPGSVHLRIIQPVNRETNQYFV